MEQAKKNMNYSVNDSRVWKIHTFDNEKGRWNVYPGLCKGCGLCIEKCPTKVIMWSDTLGFMGTPTVTPKIDGCIVCGICQTVCPDAAILVEKKGKEVPPEAMPVR